MLWLAARHSVHGSRAMPHALPCPAVYIHYVFGNDNVRKLHQHRELFQVSAAFLFASLVAPVLGIVLEAYLFIIFFNPGYCLLTDIGEGSREKSLRTSIFAMHECFCHYRFNWM